MRGRPSFDSTKVKLRLDNNHGAPAPFYFKGADMKTEVFVTSIDRCDGGRSVRFNAFVGNRIVQLTTFLYRSGAVTVPSLALVRCAAKKQGFDVLKTDRSVRAAVLDTLRSMTVLFNIGGE